MRRSRAFLVGATAVALTTVAWVMASVRDDDSGLSVLIRAVKERVCWTADSNVFCVLNAMSKYERKGHIDDAIKTGQSWTSQYPNDFTSRMIYTNISTLYLEKARTDTGRTEEYLKQALSYRDKALHLSNSANALEPLVNISEYVGDVSKAQRCIQYGNALRILDRMNLIANQEKEHLAKQFKPDLAARKQLERLSEWIDAAVKRVKNKSSMSRCQDKPDLAG